jgi:hypothetical protein
MAYLYNYIGKPWKTQERIHQILNEQYSNQPDGLSGNEDCGQMSAWYVLSSMGFYSVTPGLKYYSIGKPHFSEATINLENGNKFKVIANHISDKNSYIQSATLNGIPFNQSFLYHDTIMQVGELRTHQLQKLKVRFQLLRFLSFRHLLKHLRIQLKLKSNQLKVKMQYTTASIVLILKSMNHHFISKKV